MKIIPKGTWVEIEQIILKPEERSPSLPEDTKNVPYVLHASGFLIEDAEMGQETRIKTIIGRVLTGKIIVVNPGYTHSFGETIQELLFIGVEGEK